MSCNLLIREDFGFFCEHIDEFPPLDVYYDSCYLVKNAVLYFSSEINYEPIFEDLRKIYCQTISIIVPTVDFSVINLHQILTLCYRTGVEYIEIYIPYSTKNRAESIIDQLGNANKVLRKVIFFNAPNHTMWHLEKKFHYSIYCYEITEDILRPLFNPRNNFSVNMDTFMEANFFNTYYNAKIFINAKGEVSAGHP